MRPRSGFPREPASGGESGVLQQLSFDDLLGGAPVPEPQPRRLLTPAGELIAAVGEGMGAGAFEVRTGTHCQRCPARRSCPLHERGRQVTG